MTTAELCSMIQTALNDAQVCHQHGIEPSSRHLERMLAKALHALQDKGEH